MFRNRNQNHKSRNYENNPPENFIQSFNLVHAVARDWAWWRKQMQEWFPGAFKKLSLVDMRTGQILARTSDVQNRSPVLSEDGSTLVIDRGTDPRSSGVQQYVVWDVPQPTAWRWVLGPALALFATLLAWRGWRSRRKAAV